MEQRMIIDLPMLSIIATVKLLRLGLKRGPPVQKLADLLSFRDGRATYPHKELR